MALVKVDQSVIADSAFRSHKNIIENGNMSVWQRRTSLTGMTESNDGVVTVDRWETLLQNSTGVMDVTRETDVPTGQGFPYSLKVESTTGTGALSGSDQFVLTQKVEGQSLQHLKYGTSNAQPITLSFWAKSNRTDTFSIWLYNVAATPRQVGKLFTISTANTWQKFEFTIDGDTSTGFTNDYGTTRLYVRVTLNGGPNYTSGTLPSTWTNAVTADRYVGITGDWGEASGDDFYLTGVQLEVGNTATTFEHEPVSETERKCHRHYQSTEHFTHWYWPSTRYSNYWYLSGTMPNGRMSSDSPTMSIDGASSDQIRIWGSGYVDLTFSTQVTATVKCDGEAWSFYILPTSHPGGSAGGTAGLLSLGSRSGTGNSMFIEWYTGL